jgi:PadR family transcriptional regulator PadR
MTRPSLTPERSCGSLMCQVPDSGIYPNGFADMPPRSLGLATVSILQAIHRGRRYGVEIIDETELGGGTVYKLLHRLEKRGAVRGTWESAEVAERQRRPRRRYYDLTREGVRALEESLARIRALTGGGDPLPRGGTPVHEEP